MTTNDFQILEKLPHHPDEAKAKGWTSLLVSGEVQYPQALSLSDLFALPLKNITYDFSCEEGWTVSDLAWEGIRIPTLLQLVKPYSSARFVTFSDGDFSTSLPISEIPTARPLLALRLNGENVAPEHGGPCRLVMQGNKCYTSVKWVKEVKFTRENVADTAMSIALKRIGKA